MEFLNYAKIRKDYLACALFIATVLCLSFFGYFSFMNLFNGLQSVNLFFFFLISAFFLVSLISGISTVLHAKLRKISLKAAFYEDSLSYFASMVILFIIPVVALYPDHYALSGYAKPFFLGAWLVCCICLKIALNISDQNMKKISEWLDNRIWIVLGMLLCCYILLFFGLAKLKYTNFGGFMTDEAHFMRFFENANKGDYFGETIAGARLLGTHLSFMLYIFLVPYLAYPSTNMFLLIRAAMVGLSVIPLYLIVKRRHDPVVGVCILFTYLFYHHIAGANVFDFHEVIFAPFFLLFTYYFFEKENFFMFLIFLLASLSIKENVGVVLFLFGIYALILGRSKKWIWTPMLISGFWVIFSLSVLLPYFGPKKELYSPHVIYINRLLELLKNPYVLLGLFNKRSLGLIYSFFQPVLFFTPFLSLECLLVLPWFLVKILLSEHPSMRTWHFLIVAAFLFVAYSNSLHRMGRMIKHKRFVIGIAIVGFFVSISCLPYWFRTEEYVKKSYIEAQRETIELIPRNVSVCAPEYMLPYLVDRKTLYNEVTFQKGFRDDIDFIIFDGNIREYKKEGGRDITPEFIISLRKLTEHKISYLSYEYFWDRDGIFIYKNKRYNTK